MGAQEKILTKLQKKKKLNSQKKKNFIEKCSSVPRSESFHPKAIAIPEKENSGKCNVPQSQTAHPKVIAIPEESKSQISMTASVIAPSQKENTVLSIPKNTNSAGQDSVRKLVAKQKIFTKLQEKKRLNS